MEEEFKVKINEKELPYKVGEKLILNEKECLIIAIEVSINGAVAYKIEHFDGKDFEQDWFDERQIKCFFSSEGKGKLGFS